MPTEKQQERINKGLCPRCGKEAAPYYLCDHCRRGNSIVRVLNRLEKHDFARSRREGRNRLWFQGSNDGDAGDIGGIYPTWGEGKGENDKRLRPKLGGIPVDVEQTLIEIFRAEDRGLTMEEIYMAWGKLRLRKGRDSAAADMRAIIMAERKRERKRARLKINQDVAQSPQP